MAKDYLSGKLAVILHADVAGSTALVQQDEQVTHERIQETFRRFGDAITKYHGHVSELRGDALLAEFERASDAVSAALAFQVEQLDYLTQLKDNIQPMVRVGIAMGEVVIADNTITGTGVVLAQRLEQLASPGGVVLQGACQETIPGRFPFEYESLGEQKVKGFDESVRAYIVALKAGAAMPSPVPQVAVAEAALERPTRRWLTFSIIAFLTIEVVHRPGEILGCATPVVCPAPQKSIVRLRIDKLGFPASRFLVNSQVDRERVNNIPRHFILYRKHVGESYIISFCPDVAAGYCIDKLGINPNLIVGTANTAFQNIANAKFFSDLPNFYCLSFVSEAGVASDNK